MPARPSETGLAGTRVLVTRPLHQARNLAELIAAAGGEPVCFPTIEIAGPSDPQALTRILQHLEEFDVAIFVSTNAVDAAFTCLPKQHGELPARLEVACVGPATANALARHGLSALVPSTGDTSEALLAIPQLASVDGKRVLIFRGEGGREVLADTLRARGAHVEYAECYRRRLPAADLRPLLRQWVDVVTVHSTEALHNLFVLAGAQGRSRLQATPLIVPSPRVAAVCRGLGLAQPPYVSANASDEAMVQALRAWRASQNPV